MASARVKSKGNRVVPVINLDKACESDWKLWVSLNGRQVKVSEWIMEMMNGTLEGFWEKFASLVFVLSLLISFPEFVWWTPFICGGQIRLDVVVDVDVDDGRCCCIDVEFEHSSWVKWWWFCNSGHEIGKNVPVIVVVEVLTDEWWWLFGFWLWCNKSPDVSDNSSVEFPCFS